MDCFLYKLNFIGVYIGGDMKMMKNFIWMTFLVCGLIGCSSSKQNHDKKIARGKQVQMVDGHNARNALDYQGTYIGTLPGYTYKVVKLTIVLTEREYVLHATPLKERAEAIVRKGVYTWDANGSVITLEGLKNLPDKYFVAENQLRQLDMNGKQHVGENAANYILRKQWVP